MIPIAKRAYKNKYPWFGFKKYIVDGCMEIYNIIEHFENNGIKFSHKDTYNLFYNKKNNV